jgi:hypothetical protein
MYSPREREWIRVFAQESKDISYVWGFKARICKVKRTIQWMPSLRDKSNNIERMKDNREGCNFHRKLLEASVDKKRALKT